MRHCKVKHFYLRSKEGMGFDEITLFLIVIVFFTLGIVMVSLILRFYFGLLL